MDRARKQELVATLNEVFSNTGVIVVAHYAGLTVKDMTDLRRRMRDAGGNIRVAKNRLARRALAGTQAEGITDLFIGPTCLAYSDDPIAAPKVTVNFAKDNNKLVILGGAMGATVLDESGVKSLASLPSLDELRAKLVGLVQAPAGKLARLLNIPAGQLARVLAAKAEKGEAA